MFATFLNKNSDLAILQSFGRVDSFIDKNTSALFFRNLAGFRSIPLVLLVLGLSKIIL